MDLNGGHEIMHGFAGAARVTTRQGEVEVATLRPGDVLVAIGSATMRRVLLTRPYLPDGGLVCIGQHALEPGCPQADLRVGADQLVLAGGGDGDTALLPARALVNGATIVLEGGAPEMLWRVDLEPNARRATARGDIIMVEGLAVATSPDLPVWREREVLTSTRERALERAAQLGWMLDDRLAFDLVAGGQRLDPEAVGGGSQAFLLPAGVAEVHLRSASGIAAEIEVASRDGRRLGIAVERVVLDGAEIALDDPRLRDGFHGVEAGDGSAPWRWTDGHAVLDVAGPGRLEITARRKMQTWVRVTKRAEAAATAG